MKTSITLDEFKEYYLDNNYNENMFNNDGDINPNYNSSKKQVFWLKYLKTIGIMFIKNIKMASIGIDLMPIKK